MAVKKIKKLEIRQGDDTLVLEPQPTVVNYDAYIYFAHSDRGDGSGSSWANAKAFSVSAYGAVPANTACLLLGHGGGRYILSGTLYVAANKPIYGGFIGSGLLREPSTITRSDPTWANVRFSRYATVFTGGNFIGIRLSYSSCISGVAVGNCSEVGIMASSGTAIDCTVSNCQSVQNGGGICVSGSGMAINCTVLGCSCTRFSGGGIRVEDGTVTGCTVSNCYANAYGGGIYVDLNYDFAVVDNCVVSNCSASYGGGGIYMGNGMVSNCTVFGCRDAIPHGGGIYANRGIATGCTVFNCYANAYGGGIYVAKGGVVNSCIIYNCGATTSGGGIYVAGSATIAGCSITGCFAPESPTSNIALPSDCLAWNNTTSKQ